MIELFSWVVGVVSTIGAIAIFAAGYYVGLETATLRRTTPPPPPPEDL